MKEKEISYESIPFRKKISLNQFFIIKRLINRLRPDVVHCHNYKSNIYLVPCLIADRKIKKITTVHGYLLPPIFSLLRVYYFIDQRVLRFFDKIVLVSEKIKNKIPKKLRNDGRLHVIPNGISVEEYPVQRKTFDSKFKINNKKVNFICVGRLSREKNYGEAITLFKLISEKVPNSDLWIVGEGPEEHKLRRLVEDLDISEKVFFTGYVNNAERFIKFFDCIFITSLSEGLPITLLEAMKNQVLVAYRDVGEIDSVLMHGELGYRIEEKLEVCAGEISKILGDKPLLSKIKDDAFKRLVNFYSANSMELSYRKLYESLAK